MKSDPYLLALHSIYGLGSIRLKAILEYFKDPKLAWEAKEGEFIKIGIPKNIVDQFFQTAKKLDPLEYAASLTNSGIKWLTVFDEKYPKLLKQIYNPPAILYYKGDILPADEQAISVVGSRKMTGYGRSVTENFTAQLVAEGFTIVSGLARGVDSAAHSQALRSKGRTMAVLGGGLNNIYPAENTLLAQKIADGAGAVISEHPPDYPPMPGNFPARNRIIAGLSKAVLVTEAAAGSGSLITARFAISEGREVFAVPGPVTSSLSRGPIDLIKQGARAVFEPKEILDELGVSHTIPGLEKDKKILGGEEKKVLEVLENQTLHLDELGRMLNYPAAKISALLLKMEISGLVQNLGGGNYCKLT